MTLKGSLSYSEKFVLIIILSLNGDMMEGNSASLVEEQEGMVRVKRAVGGRKTRKAKKGGSSKTARKTKQKKGRSGNSCKHLHPDCWWERDRCWCPYTGMGCVYSSKKNSFLPSSLSQKWQKMNNVVTISHPQGGCKH